MSLLPIDFLKDFSLFESKGSFSESCFKLPKTLTFSDPSSINLSKVFLSCAIVVSNKDNKYLIEAGNLDQPPNDFFVILALARIIAVLFFLVSIIKFGQISDSIKIAILGFQFERNLYLGYSRLGISLKTSLIL